MIYSESHFNFIKIHLLSHLSDLIHQFGNIPMYSTETTELAHKTQIKDGWRHSNKTNSSCQIVHSYSRQHTIQMRLLNWASIRRQSGDLYPDTLKHLDITSSLPQEPIMRKRILKGHWDDVSNLDDFSTLLGVSFQIVVHELIPFRRHNLPPRRQLPEDPAILGSLPVVLLTQVKIPLPAFQESEVYNIHRA